MKNDLLILAAALAFLSGNLSNAEAGRPLYSPTFLKSKLDFKSSIAPSATKYKMIDRKAAIRFPKETAKSTLVFTTSKIKNDRNELYAYVYRGNGDYAWHRIASERDQWPTRYQGPQVSAQDINEWTRSIIDEPPTAVASGDTIHVFSRADKMLLHWRCNRVDLETASSGDDVSCTFEAMNPVKIVAVDTLIDGCVSATVDPAGSVHVIAREGMHDIQNPIHPALQHWTITPDGRTSFEVIRAANTIYGQDAEISAESCPAVVYNDTELSVDGQRNTVNYGDKGYANGSATYKGLQVYARGPYGDLTVWFTGVDGRSWFVRQYRDYPDRVPGGLGGRDNGRVVALFSPAEQWPHVFFHKDSPAFSGGNEQMVHAWGFGTLDPSFVGSALMQPLNAYNAPQDSRMDLSPTVVTRGYGTFHAFALSGDGLLYHQINYLGAAQYGFQSKRYFDPSGHPAYALHMDTAPAAAYDADGQIRVFARHNGKDLMVLSMPDENGNPDPSGWSLRNPSRVPAVEYLPMVKDNGETIEIDGFPAVISAQ